MTCLGEVVPGMTAIIRLKSDAPPAADPPAALGKMPLCSGIGRRATGPPQTMIAAESGLLPSGKERLEAIDFVSAGLGRLDFYSQSVLLRILPAPL